MPSSEPMNSGDEAKSNRSPARALTAWLLTAALMAGCAAPPPPVFDLGNIPVDAQLALSPSGQRLLVTWPGKAPRAEARLLTFSGKTVASIRTVPLPDDTFNIAYGRSEDHLVVTTLNRQQASALVRIDLQSDARTVLYTGAARMGFPLELGDDEHVFLEATQPGGRFGLWRRLQGRQKTLLHEQIYGRATQLDHVQGTLFLNHPTKPLSFQALQGSLPAGLQGLVDASTFMIHCADKDPLTCVRSHLFFGPTGQSFGTMEIFSGKRRCKVSGQWMDEREMLISRDGSAVVFHAPIGGRDGPRAIYRVRNEGGSCTAEQVQLEGSGG